MNKERIRTYELYNKDCLEKLKEIKDNSIDFVLIDPAYEFKCGGFGGGSKPLSKRKFKSEIKNNPLFMQEFDVDKFMNEVTRICKKVNCVVFGTDIMMYKLMNYCVKNKLLFTFTF